MHSNSDAFALAASRVFDGEQFLENHCVIVHGNVISQVVPLQQCPPEIPIQTLSPGILAPGFIDLQVNGGGDVMLSNTASVDTLKRMQSAHRALGTTAMLPTVLSDTREQHEAAIAAIRGARAEGNPGILGIHIEGPFFNGEKRGAHAASRLRAPTAQDIDWLCQPVDFVLMLTLAPEVMGPQFIRQLADAGVTVCAGHTNATYEQMNAAVDAGLQGVTHLFNAMGSLTARQPGALGAALDNHSLWAGIIADGHHVHPAGIRLAHAAKPQGQLLLVSDAMATVGGKCDSFELYGAKISVADGRLVNIDGVLAGSAIGLIDAVRYTHRVVGLPLEECLRMASLYPASQISKGTTLGRIASGYRADMVHFDEQFQVHTTWLAGEQKQHSTVKHPEAS